MRRRIVPIGWICAIAIAAIIGWSGRDRLSSSLLTTDDVRQVRIAADATWSLGCAPALATPEMAGAWRIDLVDIDAITLGDFVGRCYAVRWADDAAHAVSTNGRGSSLLLSPDLIAEWLASDDAGSPFAGTMRGIRRDLVRAERIALPITLIVLLFVTRNLALAAIPVAAGVLVAILATGLLTALAQATPVPIVAVNVVAMMGLALGIDYALLWVMRSPRGSAYPGGASRTIRMAGSVVAGASLGLLAMPLHVFRIVAVGIVLVAACAVLIATTLVPAIVGRRPAPSFPTDRGRSSVERNESRCLSSRLRIAIPLAAIAIVATILMTLGWHATRLHTGISLDMPTAVGANGGSYDAYVMESLLEMHLSSVEIAMPTTATTAEMTSLLAFVGRDPDFAPIVALGEQPDGGTAIRMVAVRPADSRDAYAAIARLRDEVRSLSPEGGGVIIGGPLATYTRVLHGIADRQLVAALAALTVAGVLISVHTRRRLLALAALAGNIAAFIAAMGVLTLLFPPDGEPARFGIAPTPHIEAWVPIVVFCVVLGLGIDYHLFLFGQHESGSTASWSLWREYRAVGPVIAAAALSMMLVFAGFAVGGSTAMRQLGIGLAAGVGIDALLVRLVLIPAIASLIDSRHQLAASGGTGNVPIPPPVEQP